MRKSPAKYGFENPFKPDPFVRRTARYLPAGGTLLDVGCGEGADSVYFARKGFRVDAIDMNRQYLKRLRKYCKGEKLTGISAENHDALSFTYPRNAYDVISCILVICCMRRSEAEHVVNQIKRSVKPGGVVMLSARNYLDPEMKEYSAGGSMVEPNTFCTQDGCCEYLYFIERGRLRRLFRGFKIHYYREGYAGCKYGEHWRHGDSTIVCERRK